MNDLILNFKNYAILPNGEYDLSDGSVFFVEAPNNSGKTTFLHALQALMEVKDDKINIVKFGEKEGEITGWIPGADGAKYQVKYEFTKEGKKKFTFIREDGTKISSITEMRAIFNYTHITASEWLSLSLTEPGRKKQRDLFINLLSDKEVKRLREIEEMVDSKKGTLFIERTTVNSEIKAQEAIIARNKLSPEDEQILKDGPKAVTLLNEIEEKASNYQKAIDNYETKYQYYNERLNAYNAMQDKHDAYDKKLTDEIEELEIMLARKREEKISLHNTNEVYKENELKKLDELFKEINSIDISEAKKEMYGDNDTPSLAERINKGKRIVQRYNSLLSIVERNNISTTDLKNLQSKAEELTKRIEDLRQEKKDIISNSKNIPARWGIEDEYVTYDGLPFYETDISASKSVRAIADLMIHINKAPIMLMGDAEKLGYKVLNELKQIADDNNKIMIFAEHNRQSTELKLVCYDEMEIPETPSNDTSNLF